jgi:hypothetical protein
VKAHRANCTVICNAVCTFAHCIQQKAVVQWNCGQFLAGGHMIAKGQRWRVPPPFAPARPSAHRIGPTLAAAPDPGPRHRARGPPSGKPGSASRCNDGAGAATIPSPTCCWASGRTPLAQRKPSSPSANNRLRRLVVIIITLNRARRKGHMGRFTCGIIPGIGKWAAPAANEVAQ